MSRPAEQGIALLIVVSLLTVIGIMGVAFAFSMHLETREATQFVSTHRSRYVAESGVAYARALLDDDRAASQTDDPTEGWATYVRGTEVDTDDDGVRDARWWPISGGEGAAAGRYAVRIVDESGKANLNAAYADPDAVPPGAINLQLLLERSGLDTAAAGTAARAIEQHRLGADKRPGRAGADDDGDGAIDEADEYQPLALRGDDRMLESLEELGAVAGLAAAQLRRLSQMATVYTRDLNLSLDGSPRVNVNTATPPELLAMLLDAGVADPWQAAVNMADAADDDLEFSRVTRSTQALLMPDQGAVGGWERDDEPVDHYRSEGSGGGDLVWSVAVPTGSYRIRVLGVEGVKAGDITIAGEPFASVNPYESLGTFALNDTLELRVSNHESDGTACAFRGIELVSEASQTGVLVRGIEAVRINEVMVEPVITLLSADAVFNPQGSDWGCPVGSPVCTNSGVGSARWTWTDPVIPPGRYHVRVFGSAAGQKVGEVSGADGVLLHGAALPDTVLVGQDHKVTLTLGKSGADGTYYFKEAALSLQPDAEYVELINLSDRDIDVGGWTIDGELAGGRAARLPVGAVIKAHGVLAAVVDLDDAQTALAGNGVSARTAWEMPDDAPAVQLEFPSGAPSPDDDWLKVSVPVTPARLTLRRDASVVDEVEYQAPLPTTTGFQSIEKGDPSVVVDADGDGVDEGWYASLRLFTPGEPNDNDGLKEIVGGETIIHDPLREVTVVNRPLGGVGELAGLPSGQAWQSLSSASLAGIVDRLTVQGHRLEAEGRLIDEVGAPGAWLEKADGTYEHTDPLKADTAGRWEWTGLVDGAYRISVYGWPGEQMTVRWVREDGAEAAWSPSLTTDAQGRLAIGRIGIGIGDTAPGTLTLDVRCASASGICHVDHVRLDPQLLRVGPVNVNTAPQDVLLALPGLTQASASRIVAGRPYGDHDGAGRGIGDLLATDVLSADEASKLDTFQRMGHLVTVRSDVFQIVSVGQAVDGARTLGSQRIQTIVERQ